MVSNLRFWYFNQICCCVIAPTSDIGYVLGTQIGIPECSECAWRQSNYCKSPPDSTDGGCTCSAEGLAVQENTCCSLPFGASYPRSSTGSQYTVWIYYKRVVGGFYLVELEADLRVVAEMMAATLAFQIVAGMAQELWWRKVNCRGNNALVPLA